MNAEALSGKVLGTCTLQKLLGRGGMGAVFLAQQSRPRRQVAVKVLLPISALQPRQRAAFLERFRRETDAAASLEHPNIVPVHEYGEQDGLAYLVMAYISGGTLRDELEREGKLSLIQTVSYLDQVADALDFAHERGVIHRDIKPANILLTPEKRLLLTDFGLVKIVTDEQRDQKQLSEAGMPLGTPDYMSPEQVVGREIDARADLYSLGIILFQMVTGSVPFKAEMPMKVAMQHLRTPPPSPRALRPDLPVAAENVILRALAKNPEDRYAHTRDFANAFRQALESAGVVLADAPGSTAAVRAMKVDRNASNRPRGLFDPLWRGHQEQSPQVKELPQAETAKLATKQATHTVGTANPVVAIKETTKTQREQQRRASEDIVAKTSMTLPSFSGILSPPMTNQPVSSLLTAQSALITSSTDTPLSDINMMQDQPTNELPRQNDQPAKGAHPNRNAPARNSLLSPNRLRPQGKTTLLGEEQKNTTNSTNDTNSTNVHNPNPTQQLNMASPAESVAQPISPHAYATGVVNSNGKTGQLRSYATNHVNMTPDTQATPGIPNLPNSTRQLNAPPSPGANGFNNTVPPASEGSTGTLDAAQQNFYQPGSTGTFNTINNQSNMAGTTGSFNFYNPAASGTTGVWKTQTGALIPVNAPGATGSLMIPSGNESTGQTGMLKLTQPVKVIKVPLAGQPGQYVTGLLPVLPSPSASTENEWSKQQEDTSLKGRIQKNMKVLILMAAVAVILFGSVIFLVSRPSASTPRVTKVITSASANKTATAAALATKATAQAIATAQANLIVNDPLSSNFHSWLNGNDKVGNTYGFQNGAYHIKVANNQNEAAVALLPNPSGLDNFVYTISLNEVSGLDNSTDAAKVNTFGLVFRFTNGANLSYYAFLIDPNSAKPTYEFQKYDAAHQNNNDPRTTLWSGSIGNEYHLNHGTNNVIKISANGTHFNFNVNGKDVGSKDDNSFGSGQIGMIVNLNGTEIAFSNLLLTHQ